MRPFSLTSTSPILPAALALVALFALAAAAARATDIVITTPADQTPTPNGNCTLREAIVAAQSNAVQDLCPAGSAVDPDVVHLLSGPHSWTQGQIFLSGTGGALILRGPADSPPTALVNITAATSERFIRILSGADLTIENVDIRGGDVTLNQSLKGGGALGGQDLIGVSLTLRNVALRGNTALFGGALYFELQSSCDPCRLTIENSVFEANLARLNSAAGLPRGGGAFLQLRGNTTATIVDSRFLLNGATSTFAGNDATAGGLYAAASDATALDIRRVEFIGNEADAGAGGNPNGAGAYLQPWGASTLRLEDARFENNHLAGPTVVGGSYMASALYLDTAFTGTFAIDRLAIVDNDESAPSAIALRIEHGTATPASARNVLVARGPERGARVSNGASALTLAHWTVTGASGEGLRLAQSGSPLRLDNSIVWGNGTDLVQSGAPTVDPSNLIGVDPLFASVPADDYRLAALSPAIDFGDQSLDPEGALDLDHAPRAAGLDTDAGAYERDALFGDGFESGDTGAWSETGP